MTILNLTMHASTESQKAAGVVDLASDSKDQLESLLNVNFGDDLKQKAKEIAELASEYSFCMIGGAPMLMPILQRELEKDSVTVLYAFSERHSEEVTNDDGSVSKKSVFKHAGFYSNDDGWFRNYY